MDVGLAGKVVLVTGATQGVGQAIAALCAESGAGAVVISGRDAERGAAVVKELAVRAAFVAADLEVPGAEDLIYDSALAAFGRVDALVNAAALTTRGSLEDADHALWARLFRVNAEAPFFLMQRHVAHLKARGVGGEIVNILSMNIHGGARDLTVYSASKAALALVTRNAAQHHRFDRIRINGIALGWTDTPAERQMQAETLGHGPGWLAQAEASLPFGRLLVPLDVARLAVFLLSDASSPMTGALIDQEQSVAGGVS